LPPQAIHPAVHPPEHVPFEHTATPPVGTGHWVPQVLQLNGSEVTSTQKPLQSTKPLWHTEPHVVPLEQDANALATGGQAAVHPPQWFGSVTRFTHRSVHVVSGGVQDDTQPADEQSLLAGHWTLHAPQAVGLRRSVSQPLVGSLSQSAHPASH
jgi:hypothetical protein